MNKCYICDKELNKTNKSKEHILLNAIGGRLISHNLLCKECNNELGEVADASLAKELEMFSNLVNVERDRGNSPQTIYSMENENIIRKSCGTLLMEKPTIKQESTEEGLRIQLTANSEEEARLELNKLKKQYPEIDIENILKSAEIKETYLANSLHKNLDFGKNEAKTSVLKTAINFFIHKGGDKQYIKHLVPFLKTQANLNDIVKTVIPNGEYIKKEENEVFHTIFIEGNQKNKIIFAYIEFYNSIGYLIKLNLDYNSKDFKYMYCFDLIKQTEIEKTYEYRITVDNIKQYELEKKEIKFKIVEEIIEKRQANELKRLSEESFPKVIENLKTKYGENYVEQENIWIELGDEHIKNIAHYFLKGMTTEEARKITEKLIYALNIIERISEEEGIQEQLGEIIVKRLEKEPDISLEEIKHILED